jgi:hypothetical protein
MQPVYVSKLFDQLEFLGIEQKAVAKALEASKPQVSLWAHSKRPMPKTLAWPFIWLVGGYNRSARTGNGKGPSHRGIIYRGNGPCPA